MSRVTLGSEMSGISQGMTPETMPSCHIYYVYLIRISNGILLHFQMRVCWIFWLNSEQYNYTTLS